MNKLKPCPFCGTESKDITVNWVNCSNKYCPLHFLVMSHEEWNERNDSKYKELRKVIIDFCNELIEIEDKENKPVQCFRDDVQVARDEIRYDMASEIADIARNVLVDLGEA